MYYLAKRALQINAIIAVNNPEYWRKIYPNNIFVHYKDTIHHVYNRPVLIYDIDSYLLNICKDIEGWSEEENNDEWVRSLYRKKQL